jgi:hypothetical protein
VAYSRCATALLSRTLKRHFFAPCLAACRIIASISRFPQPFPLCSA